MIMLDASCPSFEPFRCPEEGKCISIQVKRVSYSTQNYNNISDKSYKIEKKGKSNLTFTTVKNGFEKKCSLKCQKLLKIKGRDSKGIDTACERSAIVVMKIMEYISLCLLSICVTEQMTARMATMRTNCCVQQVGNRQGGKIVRQPAS